MSQLVTTNGHAPTSTIGQIESVLIKGDISRLTEQQRVDYYQAVCKSLGLNQLTKPFDYITLNGKMVLYAKRDATDQLRSVKHVSVIITAREKIEDVYVVTAQAKTPDGRTDESTGAVALSGLKGEQLANAMMKAETKAKRRVTLSICGLGLLDESEVETIREDRPVAFQPIANGPLPTVKHEVAAPEVLNEEPPHTVSPSQQLEAREYCANWIIEFGKFKGMAIKDVSERDVDGYIQWMEKTAAKDGKGLSVQGALLKRYAATYWGWDQDIK